MKNSIGITGYTSIIQFDLLDQLIVVSPIHCVNTRTPVEVRVTTLRSVLILILNSGFVYIPVSFIWNGEVEAT